jgi:hypothetical protein
LADLHGRYAVFPCRRLFDSLRADAIPGGAAIQSGRTIGVAPDLSFNTAISFITNTNWQNYGGESTMS